MFSRPNRFAQTSIAFSSVLVLLVTLLSAVTAIAQAGPESAESVETIKDDDTESVWLIRQPVVIEAMHEYSDKKIHFRKYDEVIVIGGGCVQTGGLGKTWKRYIDPVGSNSDRLYHGRIWIPGATDGLVRISSIVGVNLVVNKFPPHPAALSEPDPYFLRLGYEDDKLGDNGYYPKSANNGTQCALGTGRLPIEGTAWLKITAIHHSPERAPESPDPRAPLDLWWDRVDDNFLPYMPDWWTHHHDKTSTGAAVIPNSTLATGCDSFREASEPDDFLILGRSPQCTMSDPDVDEANLGSFFCHAIGPVDAVHGHVNWGAVTYRGRIYYERKSLDGDYDWALSPMDDSNYDRPSEVGVSTGNTIADGTPMADGYPLYDKLDARILGMEFSSRETLKKMTNSLWWDKFKKNLKKNRPAARRSVKGKEAIVIGLFGLDNEHGGEEDSGEVVAAAEAGARVELHPIWGLAIKTESTSSEDVWVILARNWGNEGSCSNGWDVTHGQWQHYLFLPENKMKFFLPAKFAPASVVTDFHSNYGITSTDVTANPTGNGVLLSIRLPPPRDKKLFWGELRIKKMAVSPANARK